MAYSRPHRSYSLSLHPDFDADLERLWTEDADAAATIETFVQEAEQNQEILDDLTRNKHIHYGEISYSVEVWAAMQQRRLNLWRLKFLDVDGLTKRLRIIYAFHPREYRYYLFAIVHRDFEYEPSNAIARRIAAAYDSCDIPPN